MSFSSFLLLTIYICILLWSFEIYEKIMESNVSMKNRIKIQVSLTIMDVAVGLS